MADPGLRLRRGAWNVQPTSQPTSQVCYVAPFLPTLHVEEEAAGWRGAEGAPSSSAPHAGREA